MQCMNIQYMHYMTVGNPTLIYICKNLHFVFLHILASKKMTLLWHIQSAPTWWGKLQQGAKHNTQQNAFQNESPAVNSEATLLYYIAIYNQHHKIKIKLKLCLFLVLKAALQQMIQFPESFLSLFQCFSSILMKNQKPRSQINTYEERQVLPKVQISQPKLHQANHFDRR